MTAIFPIIPASAKTIWLLAIICGLLLLIFSVLAYTAWSSRHARFEVGDGQLRLAGDLWARGIPIRALDLDRAAVLDLNKDRQYSPRRRTLGTGLPGYASGWFRLVNGEKALIYLTARDSVVYIPTSSGYSLLLSTRRVDELLTELRSRSGR